MNSLPTGDKMENFSITFDIDGTLISNINENVVQNEQFMVRIYPFDAANAE